MLGFYQNNWNNKKNPRIGFQKIIGNLKIFFLKVRGSLGPKKPPRIPSSRAGWPPEKIEKKIYKTKSSASYSKNPPLHCPKKTGKISSLFTKGVFSPLLKLLEQGKMPPMNL